MLRVPVLYGPVETLDESAVTVLFSKVISNRLFDMFKPHTMYVDSKFLALLFVQVQW